MNEQGKFSFGKGLVLFLGLAFVVSFFLKLTNVQVGAPFVTIDDNTAFEGGFLVWFGNVPPQRMYLESWLCGISSLVTFVGKAVTGNGSADLSSNLVAEAYQDYYLSPELYVQVYRLFILVLDMVTAWMVFRLGALVLGNLWRGWAAVLAAALYLFSYNTVWCDVVTRPDALVVLFTTSGLVFYFKSSHGENRNSFWLAAVFLGIGAGLKLHASLFVVFIAFDLLRVKGLRQGLALAFPLTVISVVFFALSSGVTLFDPLKYVKLRMLNIEDDKSPWIQWGEQFLVLIKGSGWLVVPAAVGGAWVVFFQRKRDSRSMVTSVLFLAVCWVVVFLSIRQLRAYWMLPALPLFYIGFLYSVSLLRNFSLKLVLVAIVLGVMVGETFLESRSFQRVEYHGLRNWVRENVGPEDPIYIYGFQAVELPKTASCIGKTQAGIIRGLAEDRANGETHVMRHLKNWEEESTLVLFDMLVGRKDQGFSYYSVFGTPFEKYKGIIDLEQMKYLFVQEGFDPVVYGLPPGYLEKFFELKAELTGPGGGGKGLSYQVFKRKRSS